MQDFTKLEVWRRSLRLTIALDHQTRSFPRVGYGWLASQVRRASASIGANIAEGCGQRSPRELSRFLQVAIASASETQHHVTLGHALGLIAPEDFRRLGGEITQLRRMLHALQKRIRATLDTDDASPTTNNSRLH